MSVSMEMGKKYKEMLQNRIVEMENIVNEMAKFRDIFHNAVEYLETAESKPENMEKIITAKLTMDEAEKQIDKLAKRLDDVEKFKAVNMDPAESKAYIEGLTKEWLQKSLDFATRALEINRKYFELAKEAHNEQLRYNKMANNWYIVANGKPADSLLYVPGIPTLNENITWLYDEAEKAYAPDLQYTRNFRADKLSKYIDDLRKKLEKYPD